LPAAHRAKVRRRRCGNSTGLTRRAHRGTRGGTGHVERRGRPSEIANDALKVEIAFCANLAAIEAASIVSRQASFERVAVRQFSNALVGDFEMHGIVEAYPGEPA